MLKKLIARFGRKAAPCARPSTRSCLEELESRLTPSPAVPSPEIIFFTETYTDAAVQVTPNFFAGTVKETITATLTPSPPVGFPGFGSTILFNLNDQQQSAQLNSNGQATVSFTLPILASLTSQTLDVSYPGSLNTVPMVGGSEFLAPLYLNFDNLLLPATRSFGQLTPQQVQPPSPGNVRPTVLRSFNTAQGETDNFGIFSFLYTDPGVINQVQVLGFTLPGFVAAQLNAYGPQFAGNSG